MPVLPLLAGLTCAVLLGGLLLLAQERPAFDGAWHWLFGLDHFGALLLIGLWAGRRKTPAFWLVPLGLLTGMVMGLLLAGLAIPPGANPTVDHPSSLLALAAMAGTAAGAFLVFLFSPLNSTRALTALGMAHGYTDGTRLDPADLGTFVASYAALAAILLALGVLVGRKSLGDR